MAYTNTIRLTLPYRLMDIYSKNYSTKDGLKFQHPFSSWYATIKIIYGLAQALGIDKLNLKDETFKHYEKEDGFLGVEINPNAVCKDKEGNLWFGSIIGLVKYNSKLGKKYLYEPRYFY